MWREYIRVANITEALFILANNENARIVAGATDLMLEMERGVRKGIETLVDITSIPNLDKIHMDGDGWIHVGPLVTHNDCASSRLIQNYALPLAQASWAVGSPQIRNRATVAGNLITASPANDTISPLMALRAVITLSSTSGERKVNLREFYTGVRKTVMRSDEMVTDIAFPKLCEREKGTFIKFALRNAQAISLANVSVIVTFIEDGRNDPSLKTIEKATITLGAVAPIIIHAAAAEEFLAGKHLDDIEIDKAARLAMLSARPINDIRGSASYRKTIVKVITKRALRLIKNGNERQELPASPVVLTGKQAALPTLITEAVQIDANTLIKTVINGKNVELADGNGKTLLRLLRENALLIGTKEACAEGECGACTIFMDGKAVLSCLIPAERAQGAVITTIEGLSNGDELHPVQDAFIQAGAVQCGYCTPGLIMTSAKLLEEKSHPSIEEIKQGISGNLCRCTGYYKIIEAIDNAARLAE